MFPATLRQALDPAVVEKTVAVKNHLFNAFTLGLVGQELPDLVGRVPRLQAAHFVPDLRRQGPGRHQGDPGQIIDDLRVNVPGTPKHRQAGPRRGAAEIFADAAFPFQPHRHPGIHLAHNSNLTYSYELWAVSCELFLFALKLLALIAHSAQLYLPPALPTFLRSFSPA